MNHYNFDVQTTTQELINWLDAYYSNNGNLLNAVVGCSGGKDSTVVLAALAKAIGPDRVYPILMPHGTQTDIEDSFAVCEFLGMTPYVCNIANTYEQLLNTVGNHFDVSQQAKINAAPMIRMSTLKAISQCVNGRFTCNANLSELYLGWFTYGGDNQGDIRPLAHMTATEVSLIGIELGLPERLVWKKPCDGLCGMSDEEKFGFSYAVLDKYIRTGICEDGEVKRQIDQMHQRNKFKVSSVPSFYPTF